MTEDFVPVPFIRTPPRIVAEITRTWGDNEDRTRPLLCQRFEEVIEYNRERGYELESWQFQSFSCVGALRDQKAGSCAGKKHDYTPGITETIIAIFKKV